MYMRYMCESVYWIQCETRDIVHSSKINVWKTAIIITIVKLNSIASVKFWIASFILNYWAIFRLQCLQIHSVLVTGYSYVWFNVNNVSSLLFRVVPLKCVGEGWKVSKTYRGLNCGRGKSGCNSFLLYRLRGIKNWLRGVVGSKTCSSSAATVFE